MEYIHFDNKEIDEFFKEVTGKEKYTMEDLMASLKDGTIRREENIGFDYILEKESYEQGIISEEPKIPITEIVIGDENRKRLKEIINSVSRIKLQADDNSISIQDFDNLANIEKRLDLEFNRVNEDDTIGIKDGSFDVFGSKYNCYCMKEVDKGYNFEDDVVVLDIDFENAINEELKIEYEWIKKHGCNFIGKRFSSFKGITAEKLEILGDEDYYIEGDLGGSYNKNEILKLLNIMESMKENTKECKKDIDKFLPVYKSIGMYADYDNSGNKGSEEYIKGNENLTRSLRGVLLQGRAVCVGYAEALYYCCDYIGVKAPKVSGEIYDSNGELLGGHAWNQAQLDGEWYNCDLTWDKDSLEKGKNLKYCLKNDDEFYKSTSDIRKKIGLDEFRECQKSFDTKTIQEKLKDLRYTELDEFSFDATEHTRVDEHDFEKELVTALQENSDFAKEVVETLGTKEKRQSIER